MLLKTKPYSFSIFFILILCCIALQSNGQASEKFDIETGKIKTISTRYFYPEFKHGKVSFKNKAYTESLLNYNLLTGEIEFISPGKDTLTLANKEKVNFLLIEDDLYRYDGSNLIRKLGEAGNISLFLQERYKLVDQKSKGAYGQEYSTVSASHQDSFYDRGVMRPLHNNSKLEFMVHRILYMQGKKDQFYPVTKRNVLKLYPEKKEELKSFIKENKVDFGKGQDVYKTIWYAENLKEL